MLKLQNCEELKLKNEALKRLILPCHLGILFFEDYDILFFEKIESTLNHIYSSFFYNIRNLESYNLTSKVFSKGVRKEHKELKKSSDKIKIHPTNKFYQILMNKRVEENLGIIIAITDLPLYSSKDDNILFLFGEAHLKHRCCVVSSLKFKEQFFNGPINHYLFEQRIIKEIIHEIGHIILGSTHCPNKFCVMRFSHEVKDIDQKSFNFCIKCKNKLNQVRALFNF